MVKNFFDRLSSICIGAAAIILALVTAVILANIIGRIFNSPVKGTYEIVQYGVMTTICLALSRTGFLKKHVSVDMIQLILPTKPRAAMELLQMLVSAAAFVAVLLLLWFRLIPETIASGRLTDIFRIPYYLVYIILSVGMILAGVMFLYQAGICALTLFGKGGDTEPGDEVEAVD